MTSEWRHLHPAAAVAHGLSGLRDLALPLILGIVLGGTRGSGSAMALGLLGVGAATVIGIVRWRSTTYRVAPGALHHRSGVFSPDETVVPIARIQAVDVVQGPLQRLFGVLELHVQTPGGGERAEVVLTAVSRRAAHELRAALGHPEDRGAGARDRLRLGGRGLVGVALTAPQFGVVLPLAGGLFALAQDALGEQTLATGGTWLERIDSPGRAVALAVLVLGATFAASVLGAVIAFAGFEVERDGDRLRIRRGLLQRRAASVPLSRVDGVSVVEGVLREPFGLVSLRLETAAGRREAAAARTLFPLVRRRDVPDVLARFAPALAGGLEPPERPPRRALRRYVTAPVVVAAAPAAALVAVRGGLWPGSLAALAAGAAFGLAAHRAAGCGLDGDRVVVRRRRLARTTLLARRSRLQQREVARSPLQRRACLASLSVTVGSGRELGVRHLEGERADALLDALAPPPG